MGTETVVITTEPPDYEQVVTQNQQKQTMFDKEFVENDNEEDELVEENVEEEEEEQEIAEEPVYVNLGKFNHVTYSHLTLYSSQC